MPQTIELEPIQRLTKDLAAATVTLSPREARYLVDVYYQMQDYRMSAAAQARTCAANAEPHAVLQWAFQQNEALEGQIKRALDKWTDSQPLGRWAKCAPPGSMVQITSGRWNSTAAIPIESLTNGQLVTAFDRRRARLTQRPIEVSETPFNGQLIGVSCGGQFTETTPSHKWLVKLQAPEEMRIVYMMRKGGHYRVGQCRAVADHSRPRGRFHLRHRAMQEGAEGVWILKLCQTRAEATIYENFVSTHYGLPMMTFLAPSSSVHLNQSGIDDFYSRLDDQTQAVRAATCLADHDLLLDIPIVTVPKANGKKEFVSCMVLQASNLVPEMMQIPLPIRGGGIDWQPVESLKRREYNGPVYSLNVAEHHKYVQDGMVTCNSVVGIGPVIAAGLLAHIDITKAPTVGHIWRFAGLDPTLKWEKGQKRPYNAALKTLCAYKLGESFVKTQNHKNGLYGKLFAQKKRELEAANDALRFAETAKQTLATKKIGKETDAYKALIQGRLPQAQVHARARRYAVKIFLSHYHAEAYRQHYGVEPPKPFAIAILGHAHMIEPG